MNPWKVMAVTIAALTVAMFFWTYAMAGPLPRPKPEVCKNQSETSYLASHHRLQREREGRLITVKGRAARILVAILHLEIRFERVYAFRVRQSGHIGTVPIPGGSVFVSIFHDQCLRHTRLLSPEKWRAAVMWLHGI